MMCVPLIRLVRVHEDELLPICRMSEMRFYYLIAAATVCYTADFPSVIDALKVLWVCLVSFPV